MSDIEGAPLSSTCAALAQSWKSGSWVTPRSIVIGSYLVRPSPLRVIASPPCLYSMTSLDRLRPPTLLTAATGEAGWFSLAGIDATFRLPTVGDQLAVGREADPVAALAGRCVRGSASARLDRAMAAMAPPLSGPIEGLCPHCGRTIQLGFDVPPFVLRELRVQALPICEHVHLLASHYQWSEEKILSLPTVRRQHYVDLVLSERQGAA